MKEANMQTFFGKYLKEKPPKKTEVYELKFVRGNSIYFAQLKPHQREALVASEEGAFFHRITDQPWIKDRPWTYTLKKPFDCFCVVKVPAYVVVWFYKPRQRKVFIKIKIKDFLKLEKEAMRKSMTEEMALSVGKKLFIT